MKKESWTVTKLSDIVFADRVELSVLNGIVHPRVKEEIQKKIAREERKKYESDADRRRTSDRGSL